MTCTLTSFALNGNGSSTGNEFSYLWTTPDGNILSGLNTLDPVIDEPGTYTIEVLNVDNGCTETDMVLIPENVTLPALSITSPGLLDCETVLLNLEASATDTTLGDFSPSWMTENRNVVSG